MAVAGSLAGCGGRDTEVTPMLDRAEAVMDAHPDSALVLLDSLDGSSTLHGLMNESDRARYALLLTQARHKNYIDETSDSLITTAVDYYDRHSSAEPFRLMLSRYYQGVVRSNSRNYASAIISLMKAEALAEHLDQPLWLGRSQLAISDIYNDIHSPGDEVRYARLAYETYRNANDSLNLKYACENLIVALGNARKFEEAWVLTQNLYDDAVKNDDKFFIRKSLSILGYLALRSNRHDEAVKAYTRLKILFPDKMSKKHYYHLSTELWNLGERDRAIQLMDSLKCSDGKDAILHPDILYERGLIEDAYFQQKRISEEADSFVGGILNQNVSATVAQYYDEEIAVKEARLRQNRTIIISIVIIVGLIVAFLVYRISISRRERLKKEEEIIDLAKELDSLNIELSSSNKRIDTLSSQSSVLLSEKSKIENERLSAVSLLCEIYHSSSSDNPGKSQKVNDALGFIKKVASDASLVSDLEEKINREHSGLMKRFKEHMPNLSERENIVFICGVLRISPIAALYIWGIKRPTFYSLRQRLRDKIMIASPAEMSIFLEYLR